LKLFHRTARQAVLGLAFFALAFALAAGTLWHGHELESGRPCAVCQLGNMPIFDPGVPAPIPALALLGWHAPVAEIVLRLDHWFRQRSSRAPPIA
jgi:hypothetical protein